MPRFRNHVLGFGDLFKTQNAILAAQFDSQCVIADAQTVAVIERGRLNALVVEIGAVGTAHIGGDVLLIPSLDAQMLARDIVVIQH